MVGWVCGWVAWVCGWLDGWLGGFVSGWVGLWVEWTCEWVSGFVGGFVGLWVGGCVGGSLRLGWVDGKSPGASLPSGQRESWFPCSPSDPGPLSFVQHSMNSQWFLWFRRETLEIFGPNVL